MDNKFFQCAQKLHNWRDVYKRQAYNFTGNINGTYDLGCELQKKRIECAIMIKAALAD